RSVARNLCFAAVGIDQPGVGVGILSREEPLHAVGADSVMAITELSAEQAEVCRCIGALNDQKVISAGGRFGEGDHGQSRSGPGVACTLSSPSHWRNPSSNSSCSRRVAATLNATRSLSWTLLRRTPLNSLSWASRTRLISSITWWAGLLVTTL